VANKGEAMAWEGVIPLGRLLPLRDLVLANVRFGS